MIPVLDILRGAVIGVANIIPGVSGGTMAVSMGIYDKLIGAVTGLLKRPKESLRILLPLGVGMGLGIVGFGFLLEYLLAHFVLATCLAFVGLVIGGLPILYCRLSSSLAAQRRRTVGAGEILSFVVLMAIGIGLPLMQGAQGAARILSADAASMAVLFVLGVVASATMVIPGVSGSMVLLVLGYYDAVLGLVTNTVRSLKALDFAGVMQNCLLLVPFGIGVVLGIFLIAKLIEYLFRNFPTQTFSAIIGLIAASPFAILYSANAFTALQPVELVVGLLLGAGGAKLTCFMGEREKS